MLRTQPVQVEVNVQDYFFANSQSSNDLTGADAEVGKQEVATNPIAVETWETWFCCWLNDLCPDISSTQSYELSLRLTDDAEVQALNAQYRHKNQPTDVLAFAALEVDYPHLEEVRSSLPLDLGDIVISVETAQQQAQQQKHSLRQELAWLATHGLLHLLGWDHPDEASLTRMLSQQQILLQTVGLTTHYD